MIYTFNCDIIVNLKINRAGGDLVRKMATRLSLDDEVLNLANSKVVRII